MRRAGRLRQVRESLAGAGRGNDHRGQRGAAAGELPSVDADLPHDGQGLAFFLLALVIDKLTPLSGACIPWGNSYELNHSAICNFRVLPGCTHVCL